MLAPIDTTLAAANDSPSADEAKMQRLAADLGKARDELAALAIGRPEPWAGMPDAVLADGTMLEAKTVPDDEAAAPSRAVLAILDRMAKDLEAFDELRRASEPPPSCVLVVLRSEPAADDDDEEVTGGELPY